MPAAPASLPDQYQFLLPAWGEKYIQVFLDYTLPSHMAAGNIGALPADATVLRVFTRNRDLEVFRSSPLFRQYEKAHQVQFESIDDLQLVQSDPYRTLTACHERALTAEADTDTAFFFINPDAVYGDGTYQACLDRFREGKRAILTHGLRADLLRFAPDLDALRPTPGEWPSLPPRRLAKLVLDNLHPLSIAHVMDGDGNKSLGSYYWRVGADGLVCRCFHVHPLAVRPLNKVTRLYTTLDHEYVRMSCPDPATVHFVTDSDELIAIELSVPTHLAEWVKTENVPDEEILEWMREWTNGPHRDAMRRTVYFHADPVTDEYRPVETAAERYATALLAEFDRRHPDAGPDMLVVSRAIRWEAEAAEARAAEVRAAVEAELAQAVADAQAAEEARRAAAAERAARPSLLRRLVRKVHRRLNRSLYDRGDRLSQTVTTLIEQRQIDGERIRVLEHGLGELRAESSRQHETAADLARQLAAVQQQFGAALERQAEAGLATANALGGVRHTHDRLLTLLSRSGVISFSDRDPARTTSQPPLGYADYDMATFVYRPAFERALRYLQGNSVTGCVAEFGTYRGFTAQTFAELLRDIHWPADLYLYDSFAGLPAPTGSDTTSYEFRREAWVEGAMTPETDIVARIRESVAGAIGEARLSIHAGFFDASLPANPPREPVAILHIDADLYSSARFVLQYLADANLLRDGGVLLMDDFNCNAANPNMGERKALTDFLADNPKWTASPWFAYGWHGQAYFLHDATVG
jgi:hypothetical protein